MFEYVHWIKLAQDMIQWRTSMKTIINLGVTERGGELLAQLSHYKLLKDCIPI